MKKQGVLILTLLGLVSFGCSSLGNGGNSTSVSATQTAGNSAQVGSAAPGTDPADELVTIARRMLAQTTYRALMETVGEPKGSSAVEFVAPNKVRAKTKDVESISIGTDHYMKVFGFWRKIDLGRLSSGREEFESIEKFGPASLSNASFSGEEPVFDKQALVYSYTVKTEMPPVEYDVRLWTSKVDGLPIKIEFYHRAGPPNMINKKRITTFSDYGANISIEPPQIQ